jgi:hypothetical protein
MNGCFTVVQATPAREPGQAATELPEMADWPGRVSALPGLPADPAAAYDQIVVIEDKGLARCGMCNLLWSSTALSLALKKPSWRILDLEDGDPPDG